MLALLKTVCAGVSGTNETLVVEPAAVAPPATVAIVRIEIAASAKG